MGNGGVPGEPRFLPGTDRDPGRRAQAQAALGDCQNGPGAVMVELAELLVATVQHADWAMFAKNGTDATTVCCTIARAHTGRRTSQVVVRVALVPPGT